MRNEKTVLVKQITDAFSCSDYVYFISFGGISVKDFSSLRDQLADQNAICVVQKNKLISKAAEQLNIAGFSAINLTQETAIVFGKGDCSSVAKIVSEFGKKNNKVTAKGGYMEGAVLLPSDVENLAMLPPKPVLQAMLLGVLQAPSRNLVTVLNAKAASVLNALNAYKEKIEKNS